MKPPPPIVTDHAVLRYLERAMGVDIEGLRKRIERTTAEAREHGASAACVQGVKYQIGRSGRVVTVTGTHSVKSKRAQRLRRRHDG
ncbi:MAG: hypothetical protein AAGM84_05505 [Pseudomonadota bacterium]